MILVMDVMYAGDATCSAIEVPTLIWQPSDRGIMPLYARLQLENASSGRT